MLIDKGALVSKRLLWQVLNAARQQTYHPDNPGEFVLRFNDPSLAYYFNASTSYVITARQVEILENACAPSLSAARHGQQASRHDLTTLASIVQSATRPPAAVVFPWQRPQIDLISRAHDRKTFTDFLDRYVRYQTCSYLT